MLNLNACMLYNRNVEYRIVEKVIQISNLFFGPRLGSGSLAESSLHQTIHTPISNASENTISYIKMLVSFTI